MPELPEVETIVRDLRPRLEGRRFVGATLSHDDVLRGVSRRALLAGLRDARVRATSRRAKHAVIDTDTRRLVVQPGMTGSLQVRERPAGGSNGDYAVLRVALDDGRELLYRDVRRLGTLLWLHQRGRDRYPAAVGPERPHRGFTPAAPGRGAARPRGVARPGGRGPVHRGGGPRAARPGLPAGRAGRDPRPLAGG